MNVLDNRELSWLAFNQRVLEQAARADVPLLERLRFAAIFENNLNEFFMVRTGALINRSTDDDGALDPRTRLSPSEQLARIYRAVRQITAREENILARLMSELSAEGIRRVKYEELDPAQHVVADVFFEDRVKPALNIISGAEGAFVAGGRLCAAGAADGDAAIAVCSPELPPLTALPGENGFDFILTEDLLAARAGEIFGSDDTAVFTLTRSADIDLDDLPLGEMPITDAVRQAVSLRSALPAVRMRVSGGSEQLMMLFGEKFTLTAAQIFRCPPNVPLGIEYVSRLTETFSNRKELFYPPFTPRTKSGSVIEEVLDGDVLISCPYEDFSRFTALLDEAADDSRVTSIKMTLYRTAKNSCIIDALCRAAENGKAVTVCVEFKARFDERHNIECAERLKKAGCTVIFGLYGMKVHSKICVITLKTDGELVKLTQVGTGNYNESTASQYTDLMLLTADNDISADAENVFDSLAGGHLPDGTFSLLAAPLGLKERVLSLIDSEQAAAESGAAAYIGLKLNGLSDRDIIAALTRASQAGVRVELIVRGICCLRPGVEGMTDNIRVVSVIGRFLEHARIYIFGSGRRQRVYISSADLMTRNTRRRVEIAAPIHDKALKKRVTDYFAAQFADGTAWEKLPDGNYRRVSGGGADSQELFMEEQGYLPAKKAATATETANITLDKINPAPEEGHGRAENVSKNQDGYHRYVDNYSILNISVPLKDNIADMSKNQNSYSGYVDNFATFEIPSEPPVSGQNSDNKSVLSDNISDNAELSTVSDEETSAASETIKLKDMSENRDSNFSPENDTPAPDEADVQYGENEAQEDMSENEDDFDPTDETEAQEDSPESENAPDPTDETEAPEDSPESENTPDPTDETEAQEDSPESEDDSDLTDETEAQEDSPESENAPDPTEETEVQEDSPESENAPDPTDETEAPEDSPESENAPDPTDETEAQEDSPESEDDPDPTDETEAQEDSPESEDAPDPTDETKTQEDSPESENAPDPTDETEAPEDSPESEDAPGAEMPPAAIEPQKQGFFTKIASFFKRFGRNG